MTGASSMEKYLFMPSVLRLLSQDRFLCSVVAATLKVGAAVLVLLSLTNFFIAGKLIFDLPVNGILGGVFFEVFLVLAVYAAAHALIIRSREIAELSAGPFVALRLAPALFKGIAEAYAGFVCLVAIGGGVFVWFTNLSLDKVLSPLARDLFPHVRDDPSFMGGIDFILGGFAASIVAVLGAYMLAEICTMLVRPTKVVEQVPQPQPRSHAEERFRTRLGP